MSLELSLFACSRVALPFAMGAVAYIGALHLWFATERDPAHRWVALWCAFGLLFQATRYAQLVTDDPVIAVRMSRLMVAVTPLLIWSMAGLTYSLARGAPIPRWLSLCLAPVLALSAVIAFTPLMVSGETYTRTDLFGREHLGVPSTPWVTLLLPGIAATIWLAWSELSHSPQLGASQRRVLLATFSIYAGMGVLSVLTGVRWISIPMVFEFGPLVVAIGLNYLLVDRHRRWQGDLSRLVDERTAEIGAARDRLERSEARYRSLLEQAPIGVVAIDPSGRVRSLNPALRRLLGIPPGEEVSSIQTLDHERLVESGISAAILNCLETGEPVADEFTFHGARTGRLRLRINLVASRDELGGISGVVGVADDVTERRGLEQRLRQAQKMESVGVLAAGIAHEINNPMAYVRANLAHMRGTFEALRSLAEKSAPTPSDTVLIDEWDELIDECQVGVQRVVSIVKDMREFSQAGGEDRVPVDLADVMRTSVGVAAARCTGGRRIEQHYEPVEPVPCLPGPLRQVFVNLLVNALQAVGPEGTVRVEVCDEPDAVLARVSDDGCGIARGDLHRLFDPFFTTKPTGEGTGLGLSISWHIVKLLGGEIRVHSEPGTGSAFEVRLPKLSASPTSSAPAV